MDSQLSLFGFEEAPSDKKEETKVKTTTKKQVAKDAAPESSLFGEDRSTKIPESEKEISADAISEEINDEIVEQEGEINTASEEKIFPTTENYSISEEEYQQLEENSENDFPWDEQESIADEIYADEQVESENVAADGNVAENYTEEPTIYISEEEEEEEYIEPSPEFENEISEEPIEEAPFDTEDNNEIVVDEALDNIEIIPEITEYPIEEENISDKEIPAKEEDLFSNAELTNEVSEVEPEYIEPIPQFESEEKQTEFEEDIEETEDISNVSDNIEENAPQIESQLEDNSVDSINEAGNITEENEPEYIESIPRFESEENQAEYEKDLTEIGATSETSDKLEDENSLIESQTENDHLPEEELSIDYPAFWDEKVEEDNIPEPNAAKDLFGETIITPSKNVFKAGKRGRKSFKEIDAEVDLIDVPEDDLLFSKQYYPISEVAKWFRVNNSLLRFWENEFDILKPRKNRKGDRLFRPEDIKNLQVIYYLLRNKKYTIEGAKKYLKTNKKTADINLQIIHALNNFKGFLLELKANAS